MDRLEILDKPFRRYTDADVEKFFEQIEDIMSVYAEHVPRTCMQDEIPYREHISDEYQSKKEYAQKAINQACAFVNYTERGIADPDYLDLYTSIPQKCKDSSHHIRQWSSTNPVHHFLRLALNDLEQTFRYVNNQKLYKEITSLKGLLIKKEKKCKKI